MPEFALDKRYVNVTGDTMTGNLKMSDASVVVGDSLVSERIILNPAGVMHCGHDFKMARTWDGDYNWKRALVPYANTMILNYAGDFTDGVRVAGSSLKPDVDDQTSLGSSSLRWKEIYFSGNLYGGSAREGKIQLDGGYRWLGLKTRNGNYSWLIGDDADENLEISVYDHTADSYTWGILELLPDGKVNIGQNNVTIKGNLEVGSSTANKTLDVYGSITGRRNSDGTNASMVNLYNPDTGRHWHVPVRASEGDRLNFYFHDGSSWHTVMKLNWNPERLETKHIIPLADVTYDLGDGSHYWHNLYLKGTIYTDDYVAFGRAARPTRIVFFSNSGGTFDNCLEVRLFDDYTDNFWSFAYPDENTLYLWLWWYDGAWHRAAYIRDYDRKLFTDGGYDTFCPRLPDDEDEVERMVLAEVEKPHPDRDEHGRIICPVCGKPTGKSSEEEGVCSDPDHWRTVEDMYARDVTKMAMGSGRLVVRLRRKVRELEATVEDLRAENEELKQRLEKLEAMIGRLAGAGM